MMDVTKTFGELRIDGYTEPARSNITFINEQNRIAKEKPTVLKCATPISDKESGEYEDDLEITLSTTTEGADIYYTVNGDTPTKDSTKVSGLVLIASDDLPLTLKAIAIKDGFEDSEVMVKEYTLKV